MKRGFLPAAGAALLVIVGALRLPRPYTLLHSDPNPFRRTRSPFDGRLYALVDAAGPSIPAGSRVAVEAPGATPQESAYCAMVVSGLLPGREVRPAPSPENWQADFVIRLNGGGPASGGRLLFRLAEGEVWRPDR